MKPFRIHTGLVAPLDRANVDTDQIIPKQFLKRIERTGFGEFVFYDWRFLPTGEPDSSFVLNDPREHAPWALADYGFRALIAPSFADIFANNCVKNGLLPVTLRAAEVAAIVDKARVSDKYELTIDLERRIVSDAGGFSTSIVIDDYRRHCLMEGLDDIGQTLLHEVEIAAFEQSRLS